MRRYRVFRPLVNGVRRWALNAVENGKRRRIIVHPETGEPFRSRAEVEALIEELRGQNVRGSGALVKDLAKYLFTPGGPGHSAKPAGEATDRSRRTLWANMSSRCGCTSFRAWEKRYSRISPRRPSTSGSTAWT